jgi:hypothetical protein
MAESLVGQTRTFIQAYKDFQEYLKRGQRAEPTPNPKGHRKPRVDFLADKTRPGAITQ